MTLMTIGSIAVGEKHKGGRQDKRAAQQSPRAQLGFPEAGQGHAPLPSQIVQVDKTPSGVICPAQGDA